jgi:molybdopterin-guanine dinucleotide biosynthesis protein A
MSEGAVVDDRRETNHLAGVILAGGRSRRMGRANKALLSLSGKPLLLHVIDRVACQVEELLLSVEKTSRSFDDFGLPQVADARPGGGPLGGLLAAMQRMDPVRNWMLLVPCDAPLLPLNLAETLVESAIAAGFPAAVASYEGEIQPTFSIWNREILPLLEKAVTVEGMAGFKQFLGRVEMAQEPWPRETPSPFFNVNDQATLQEAEMLLIKAKEDSICSA